MVRAARESIVISRDGSLLALVIVTVFTQLISDHLHHRVGSAMGICAVIMDHVTKTQTRYN